MNDDRNQQGGSQQQPAQNQSSNSSGGNSQQQTTGNQEENPQTGTSWNNYRTREMSDNSKGRSGDEENTTIGNP